MKLFSTTGSAPPVPVVRNLADANPDYTVILEKQATLRARRGELEAEQADRAAKARVEQHDGGRGERVAELLGDAEPEKSDHLGRLHEISGQIRDIDAALAVLDARKMRERSLASIVICDEVRPAYDAAVGEVAKALRTAYDASARLQRIVDDLSDADVAWSGHLPPMQPSRILGGVREHSSPLGYYLREAAAAGYISHASIPEPLQ